VVATPLRVLPPQAHDQQVGVVRDVAAFDMAINLFDGTSKALFHVSSELHQILYMMSTFLNSLVYADSMVCDLERFSCAFQGFSRERENSFPDSFQ
jgi:hypothetical protein